MAKFLEKLVNAITDVQKRNRDNPNEDTAPEGLFGKIADTIGELKKRNEKRQEKGRKSILDIFRKKVEEIQKENEADPAEVTAPGSVFDEIGKHVQQLEEEDDDDFIIVEADAPTRMEAPEVIEPIPPQPIEINIDPTPVEASSPAREEPVTMPAADSVPMPIGALALIRTPGGGSLQLRKDPDMGSEKENVLIPNSGKVRVVRNSVKKIFIDKQYSNWVMVDYEGQQGWILDLYLKKG